MKTFPLGLEDEQLARWKAEADRVGAKSLAAYIRGMVEEGIRQGVRPSQAKPDAQPLPGRSDDLTAFRGPDFVRGKGA